MNERIRKTSTSEKSEEQAPHGATALAERRQKLTSDIDALLEEIDGVLEQNAEEFVAGYVQRGGE